MDIDMVSMTNFGKAMSKHFLNCEPRECIEQINEALNAIDITVFDYNFLLGVRRGVEERL
jgi:hypothetical protein